jgi:hypothetical protein
MEDEDDENEVVMKKPTAAEAPSPKKAAVTKKPAQAKPVKKKPGTMAPKMKAAKMKKTASAGSSTGALPLAISCHVGRVQGRQRCTCCARFCIGCALTWPGAEEETRDVYKARKFKQILPALDPKVRQLWRETEDMPIGVRRKAQTKILNMALKRTDKGNLEMTDAEVFSDMWYRKREKFEIDQNRGAAWCHKHMVFFVHVRPFGMLCTAIFLSSFCSTMLLPPCSCRQVLYSHFPLRHVDYNYIAVLATFCCSCWPSLTWQARFLK